MFSTITKIATTTLSVFITTAVISADNTSADKYKLNTKKNHALQSGEIKQLSGISIIGNKEAPKALYIVPWHNTKLKQGYSMSSRLSGNSLQAVDNEAIRHELKLYNLGKTGNYQLAP